jgi:hypothetical protein
VWARAGCWLAGEQEAVLGGQARGQQRFGAVVEQQCARPEQLAFLSSIFFFPSVSSVPIADEGPRATI